MRATIAIRAPQVVHLMKKVDRVTKHKTIVRRNLGRQPAAIDYALILDFEATCHDPNETPLEPNNEIIEFPTLLYSLKDGTVVDEFHTYVKPTLNPQLTKFCTELTGIEQGTVDSAPTFPEAMRLHESWLQKHGLTQDIHGDVSGNKTNSFVYMTCGDWDFKTCLPHNCSLHKMYVPRHMLTWLNIKRDFRRYFKKNPDGGMIGMLQLLNLELEGRHHSGIDDCRNVRRILDAMLDDGYRPGA